MASDPNICKIVMEVMDERKGVFGKDVPEVAAYIRAKKGLECSNRQISRALCSLVFNGTIKKANFNTMAETLDTANGDKAVIFYMEGVPDSHFSPEFLDFIDARKKLNPVAA